MTIHIQFSLSIVTPSHFLKLFLIRQKKSVYKLDGKVDFLGMAVIAMCFNLMQEKVVWGVINLGRKLGLLKSRN